MLYNEKRKVIFMKEKLFKVMPLIFIGAIVVVVVIILNQKGVFGSSNNNDKPIEPKEEEKPTSTPAPKSNIKIIDVNSDTRPYAIMINCHNDALPQSGLQDAYMVYEIMVEYGITRMMALFKDVNFTKVGSIRSIRSQYLPYVFENDAILVHAGGQLEATNRISKEGIARIDADGQYGQRDKELRKKRAYEHTLFTTNSLLNKAVSDNGIRKTTEVAPLLTYSEEELDL